MRLKLASSAFLLLLSWTVWAPSGTASDGNVGFDDVLANPDDVQLNIRYAKSLIEKGDLRHAASTLERVLLVHPDIASVRILYATLLYRLDSPDQARYELEIAGQSTLSPDQKYIVEQLIEAIDSKDFNTFVSGSFGAGLVSDDNRGANPSSGSALAFDVPLPTGENEEDVARLVMANLNIKRVLQDNPKRQLIGSISLYQSDQEELNHLDLLTVGGSLGFRHVGKKQIAQLNLKGRILNVDGRDYFESFGLEGRMQKSVTDKLTGWISVGWNDESFSALEGSAVSKLRTGDRKQATVGASFKVSDTFSLSAQFQTSRKDAEMDAFAFDGKRLKIGLRHEIDDHQKIWVDGSKRWEEYDGADVLISELVRDDEISQIRAGYSFSPKHMFSNSLAINKDAVRVSLTYTRYEANSNIVNYDYEGRRLKFTITKPFFGAF
jgi:hypothetical protein